MSSKWHKLCIGGPKCRNPWTWWDPLNDDWSVVPTLKGPRVHNKLSHTKINGNSLHIRTKEAQKMVTTAILTTPSALQMLRFAELRMSFVTGMRRMKSRWSVAGAFLYRFRIFCSCGLRLTWGVETWFCIFTMCCYTFVYKNTRSSGL